MAQTVESCGESPTSVDALFASWQPSLLRYARTLCGTPELAEDLVQEAFLALCRKSVRGEDVRNPRRWTLCVVRNQASRQLRDRRRHGEQLTPPEVLEAVGNRDFSKAAADPGCEVSRLVSVSVLSARERQVLDLRMQSLKYRQIAQHLGVSPKTVSALLARARRKLQEAMATRAV